MNFNSVKTVKTHFTKDEFKRAVLIHLAKETNTPLDVINNIEFSDVMETTEEVATVEARVKTDYTASIGYHRKETYYEDDSDGNLYTKSRTVTDWRPHNGHEESNQSSACFNAASDNQNEAKMNAQMEMIEYLNPDDFVEKGSATLFDATCKTLESQCVAQHEEYLRGRIPGDEYKDLNYYYYYIPQELNCIIFPKYRVNYTYNGNVYTAESYACGLLSIQGTWPERVDKLEDKANKKTRIGKLIFLIPTWIAFFGLIGYAFYLMYTKANYFSFFIPFLAEIALIVIGIISDSAYVNKLSKLIIESQRLKINELEKKLSEMGYAKLTESELKSFGSLLRDFVNKKGKSTAMINFIICSIPMAILVFFTFIIRLFTGGKAAG